VGGENALRVKLFGSLDRSRGIAPDFLPEMHGGRSEKALIHGRSLPSVSRTTSHCRQ
jgi:hypothetical protein